MRPTRFISILMMIFCIISCARTNMLEQVLELSGDNRPELEKVLEHYKDDSLKLKAAEYPCHLETTLLDQGVATEDIPLLFRNPYKKDVTAEYVMPADVKVNLTTDAPQDASYAYLCLYGNEQWTPVSFGKIEESAVTFRNMGRDVVYLPAFYKNGNVLPAAPPVLLQQDGRSRVLSPSTEKEIIAVRNLVGSYLVRLNQEYMTCMQGSIFLAGNQLHKMDTLCILVDTLSTDQVRVNCKEHSPVRYVRCLLPSDSIALSDLSFYTSTGKIPGVKVTSSFSSRNRQEHVGLLTDDYVASVFSGTSDSRFVDFDLGREYMLESIGLYPYMKSELKKEHEFELFYWDGFWRSLGKKQGNLNYLTFDNVPKNALLFLKDCNRKGKAYERMFIYDMGCTDWK